MGAGNPEALGVGSRSVVLPCSAELMRFTSIVSLKGGYTGGIDLGKDDLGSPLKNFEFVKMFFLKE